MPLRLARRVVGEERSHGSGFGDDFLLDPLAPRAVGVELVVETLEEVVRHDYDRFGFLIG